ncbi:EMILIN-2 [Larimichthys crocea]|uniref:Uncharacterized protein n=1 Tax=Larimichthys crocea TaxID=215358 RepID=A0ACD3QRA6_LARCR|nr:EMILIN-2 [Larimichthys crocea]
MAPIKGDSLGAHTSLYMRSDTTNKCRAVKQMHMCADSTPCAVFTVTHQFLSAHVCLTGRLFLPSTLNYPFPQGEGTNCLVIEHVALPWYAAGVQVTVEDTGLPQGSNKIITVPVVPLDASLPQPPVMETGEAGPPGRMTSSKLPKGTDGSMMPVQGFAGAPATPQVKSTDSLKPSTPLILDVNLPHRPSPQKPAKASGETVSFSAGLTLPSFQGEIGIIRFNKVLVNDGGHYNAHTGIFTAPTEGRYLVTAVLAAQRGERVEAVLSVSSRSIQKLDSTGFLSGVTAPSSHDQCNCSSSTSLSLVLPLKRGDRVGLVLTAGKLAISASSEILSSFSAVLLYPSPSKR